MTWAVVRRFMSGRGGFGMMYRDLGFAPDPALDDEGIFDLVCGRPYCNLSREPRMQFQSLPFEHNFELLRRLDVIASLGRPVVIGFSRKRSLGRVLGDPDATSGPLSASIAAAVTAYERGATILRVHDVREHVEALAVARAVVA